MFLYSYKYLLSDYYVPGTILGFGDTTVVNTAKAPGHIELTFREQEKTE